MLGFDMIAELCLTLYTGKCARLVQGDGVRSVQNRVPRLYVEQVELDGIARVHVAVRKEVFAPQQNCFAFVDSLLAQRL